MIKLLKAKTRRLINQLKPSNRHFYPTLRARKRWYGNDYGGFHANPELITNSSIVYSFGIGEDISFDEEVIVAHGCTVYGFDPTPKSRLWIEETTTPPNFHFLPIGISKTSGTLDFYLPSNPRHTSGSFEAQTNVSNLHRVQVAAKSFSDIVAILGHNKIDLLKMDIEGTEYEVLGSILSHPIPINQILIEFHARFFPDGTERTRRAIQLLESHGYGLFAISDTFEEFSFIQRRHAHDLRKGMASRLFAPFHRNQSPTQSELNASDLK